MIEATKHDADSQRALPEFAAAPRAGRRTQHRRTTVAGRWTALIVGASTAVLSACGGGSSSDGNLSVPSGTAVTKPGEQGLLEGAAFIAESNQSGEAAEFRIRDMAWGRLVDIFDTRLRPGVTEAEYNLDPFNQELFEAREVYGDFLIGENVRTAFEGGELKWELTSNAVTGEQRLRINFDAEVDKNLFAIRVAQAAEDVEPVDPKGFAITELPPYTLVARNCALSVRFDDLIDADTIGLHSTVKVLAGTPPITPFDARVFADPNHGGIAGGEFHSTRMLIDFTISQDELASLGQVVQANGVGLPPSENTSSPNVAIRFPTVPNSSVGQFAVLRNLSGGIVDTDDSGPVDFASPTLDVAWGMRAGNPSDENNGFLIDLEQPQLIGVQPVVVTNVSFPSPDTTTNEDLVVSLSFDVESCSVDPVPGDVIQISDVLRVEVLEASTAVGGNAANIRVNVPSDAPASILSDLESSNPDLLFEIAGAAQYLTPWRSLLGLSKAPCFVRFAPAAKQLPASQVDPESDVIVRFSEPIDPDTVRPFDTVYIALGSDIDASLTEDTGVFKAPKPGDLVLGTVIPSPDFREARFSPSVPFNHSSGAIESYFFNLLSNLESGGVTDLAGNVLLEDLPRVEFQLDPNAEAQNTGSWVLRFNSVAEDGQPGPEVRGQFLYDSDNGVLIPRPVQHFTAAIDRSQPMIGVMQAIPTGLLTPLSSQGSKAHLIWRYMDAGFEISQIDDLFYNLDVEGLALAPLGGQVVATAYDEFEIVLGHAKNLPDEAVDAGSLLPEYPSSGFGNNASFADNFLQDPQSGPFVMHPRQLGFTVNSTDVFVSTTGTSMLQMPWNQGIDPEDRTYFTWRDTSIQTYGNQNGSNLVGGGAPTLQEVNVIGLSSPQGDVFGKSIGLGADATPLGIPTPGLPLLMEYRCYPNEEASLNNFDVSIAITSSPRPFFRAFSTGGQNTGGTLVNKDPDLQVNPTGGFNGNPLLAAIGAPTAPRDPTVYLGQMDLVTRVSRAYTIMMDAEQNPGGAATTPYQYAANVIEPAPGDQPAGTSLVLAWRGDNAISDAMLDASRLDVFGEPIRGPLSETEPQNSPFLWVDPAWKDDLSGIEGQRYVQTRITFISNALSELSPTINSYGLAFFR